MDSIYESTALYADQPIDARCLSLSVEFYQLEPRQVIALSQEVAEWLLVLMEQSFVSRFIANGKKGTKQKILALSAESVKAGTGCLWGMEAFVKSPKVYNCRSMDTYLATAYSSNHKLSPEVSVDFPSFWNNLFSRDKVVACIEPGILEVFRKTNKKHIAGYCLPDLQFIFSANPYRSNSMLLYGHFNIHLSRLCIGYLIDCIANTFCNFAKRVSDSYVNINARVQLQPVTATWGSPYMRYFGANGKVDGSHFEVGYSAKEWYSTYYVPGVEWFNVLSPLSQYHIAKIDIETATMQDAYVEKLSHGGLIVASKKAIDEYDVIDSIHLKKLIYPVLYPGGMHIPLRVLFSDDPSKFMFGVLPRCNWAIVPLLDDEIEIIGSELVFRKNMTTRHE